MNIRVKYPRINPEISKKKPKRIKIILFFSVNKYVYSQTHKKTIPILNNFSCCEIHIKT